MNRLKTALLYCLIVFNALAFTACEKSDNELDPVSTKYPVEGLWEGTYLTNSVNHGPTYASFIFYEDGTLIRRNKVVGNNNNYSLTRGKWSMNDSTISYRDTTLDYVGGMVVETGTMKYHNDGTMTDATWENIAGQTHTGTYQNIKRIN